MEAFGSTRTTNPIGQIAGSEFARISIGAVLALVQSFTGQYGRQARPIMSIGDPQIYFVPGQGQGTIALGRLIGDDGMFALLDRVGDCGNITNLQMSAGGGRCMVAPTQTLNFGGAMLENIGIAMQSTQPEIVENYSIRIASLERVKLAA